MANNREIHGDHYNLAVVQKRATAPPMADKMLKALLDEMGAQGNFSFHPSGPLDPALQNGDPRIIARIDDGVILLNLRWGEGPDNSVRGNLFLPNGRTPPEVLREINRRLEYLNGEWREFGLNGSMKTASPPIEPIKVAPSQPIRVAMPAPASAPKLSAPIPTSAAPTDKVEAIAIALFKKAGANATIKYYQIRDYLARHLDDGSGSPILYSEWTGRLETEGVLRRTIVDSGNSQWQFTEKFLETHGFTVAEYKPLSAVTPKRIGNGRPAPAHVAALAVSPSIATTSAPAPIPAPPLSSIAKLKQLNADLVRLLAERKQMEEAAEAANRAFGATQEKIDAVKLEILTTVACLAKEQAP